MRTAIVYMSTHHGNTKKLVNAIAQKYPVTLIDITALPEKDLRPYDLIGFASGVAFGKYYPELLQYMEKNLPAGKQVFFLHTAGNPRENQNLAAKEIADIKGCCCLGTYYCKGWDTFGPFRLVGGIAKGHPNEQDVEKAVRFFDNIKNA